ncbi:hypothetical protein HN031_15805 [Nocardioides sp. zg-1308]|uniref:Uncharacterized protein n=1 Tax=Nocardioides renjunii TaxID=3095075 RepID=A0ABU5KB14_9ACTN|nr:MULTISPECIES: hypothetical protein [unclassified Nocardioides]MDZ5662148.1 hypothetical protein [Nocardioides sp. S-58]NPD06144.1 hypothetical protein [Nocardioides sp. zg-1308]WQQ24385.1 hypothetical protein SHK17_10430 [Nocardioides sp. S-34]
MAAPSTSPTPAASTWAFLTRNELTWRQATEGWAVLTALGAFAATAAAFFKLARVVGRTRF